MLLVIVQRTLLKAKLFDPQTPLSMKCNQPTLRTRLKIPEQIVRRRCTSWRTPPVSLKIGTPRLCPNGWKAGMAYRRWMERMQVLRLFWSLLIFWKRLWSEKINCHNSLMNIVHIYCIWLLCTLYPLYWRQKQIQETHPSWQPFPEANLMVSSPNGQSQLASGYNKRLRVICKEREMQSKSPHFVWIGGSGGDELWVWAMGLVLARGNNSMGWMGLGSSLFCFFLRPLCMSPSPCINLNTALRRFWFPPLLRLFLYSKDEAKIHRWKRAFTLAKASSALRCAEYWGTTSWECGFFDVCYLVTNARHRHQY